MKQVSSRDNAYFKHLRQIAHSSRERRKARCTLIDGVHLIQAARVAAQPIEAVVVSERGLLDDEIAALVQACSTSDVPVTCLADALFSQVSPVDTPSGVLGVMRLPEPPAASKGFSGSLLVLEDIQDPGNLGTILRTAAAVGIKDVLLSGACAQVWHPRVLRAGMGGHFRLRLHQGLDVVHALSGFPGRVLATVPGSHSRSVYAFQLDQPVAWLFGGEGSGLSRELQGLAHECVCIPMPGQVESLNVGAAVAVCLFEQLRQQAG